MALADWGGADLVLLDALDLSSQQDDRTRSRLASLDLLERLEELPVSARPRVVVYSTHMAAPEVNIPLRQAGVADAFYNLAVLWQHVGDVLQGAGGHQVEPPSDGDWARLHPRLTSATDVARLHQRMRRHDRAWRQVWLDQAPFDRAAQLWIHRNVLDLLGPDVRTYRMAIDVTRRVAGLPYRSP
jgi:hypothetical protein